MSVDKSNYYQATDFYRITSAKDIQGRLLFQDHYSLQRIKDALILEHCTE